MRLDSINRKPKSALRPASIIALSFAILIAVGTLLLSLPIAWVDGGVHPLDALFTATSAVCVTGLVVVDTSTAFTMFGEIVILLLIQMGGLGYMTIATAAAILLGRELGVTQRIQLQESHGQYRLSGMIRLTRNTAIYALMIEAIGALILITRFAFDPNINGVRAIYYGVFHAVSAFCNAGFDLMGVIYGKFSGITHYAQDPVVSLTIAGLIIIGGMGYPVVEELLQRKKRRRLTTHAKLVVYTTAALLVVGTVLILGIEWTNADTIGNMPIGGKLLASFFQSVTARSSGYNTINISQVHATTLFIMGILMFIGASPGGTGGGVKTTTFVLMLLAVYSVAKGKTDTEAFGRRIPPEEVYRALTITILAAILVLAATTILTFTEVDVADANGRASFMNVQFETISAWGTVGLTTGITPSLSTMGRLIIIFVMYIGRIGPLTAFAALALREKPVRRRLAEEHVVIG